MRFVLTFAAVAASSIGADLIPAPLTIDQKEAFLKSAPIEAVKDAKKGITGTVRAKLADGQMAHDASIQVIDEYKAKFEGTRGTEFNFRDTYLFNIAAWKLGRMLGLESMIPPSVMREYHGHKGAFTWWIENVQMDEVERMKTHAAAPDAQRFNRETAIMRVFDELIYNTDRNAQNILYDRSWHLWMIDHTRAFRVNDKLMTPKRLEWCDRLMLQRMKALTLEALTAELGGYLRPAEIKSILARRDRIVEFFDGRTEKLFDYLGAGLGS